MTTRDELINLMQATANLAPVAVETKAWGTVYVKPPTVEEIDESNQADEEKRKEEEAEGRKDKYRFARSAARVLCDEAGNRLFDPTAQADVELLARQPWALLQKVLGAAQGEEAKGN